ncbi:substrate-binding domain-containing protein [Lachnoanaerobaculum umeaense]|jgi:two-component sensor histidine kinase/response regulator|uniref:Sugar ABC transporter substrate-binding protein n=1 Tax=Lachnoanaerobaculum umeaense TaxID=617123 RepID=A0A385Q239_9FIRM|nr:substrate-binding domain-containing protein [Lachnoanaerobaculum umeaense]AYB00286.1 sugar ABC transporter substrate-binding protein [Lachnoanaerobaculum umeaense]PZW96096.1 monosaccharide ABC transporter substrate-binding protein (CUT2 family) [Lachnoanaerobaculum umeaense]
MRIKALTAIALAAMVLNATGCAQGGDSSKTEAGQSAAEQTVKDESTAESAQKTEGDAQKSDGDSQILTKGPHGETGVDANTITISDEQKEAIKAGNFKVAICMHYGGNDWATAQLDAIKATCADLNMEVVAVTDANFSAEKQVSDIETVMALKPDAIISIPTDVVATADAYKRAIDSGIKVVFMDNAMEDMVGGKDYVSCVSADSYGNGVVAARLLGNKLNGSGKVGMVYYDADFFVTNQRDAGFRDTLKSEFPNIEIVVEQGFTDENGCNEQADAILTQFPNIDGIYASWDIPMEGILSSVRAAGKEGQIALVAIDLGNNIALEIAKGTVVGVGAQMPYDQGVAETKLAALSLIGESTPEYVVCPAMMVDKENVLDAYKAVYHVDAPSWLVEADK